MRVIYSIGAKFAGGGIGTIAYYAVRGLHRHGLLHRLLCGSFQPTEIPREHIRALGLPSRVLRRLALYNSSGHVNHAHNLLYDLWARRQLVPCGLFHGWNGFSLYTLRQAKRLGAITVVERASSHPLWRTRLLREEYERWGVSSRPPTAGLHRSIAELHMADYVLIPSRYVHNTFVEHKFPAEKLIQIPFGVDLNRFRPAHNMPARPFRALFVGTVTIAKGVLYLLEAWRRLRWQDAELWLVGRVSSETKPLLRPYAGMAGLRFLGHQANIAQVYQQVDVFVFPSIDEGSALVTYEALACGLPVVTTPNAGSVVRDGVEGFIVPIRDVDALAAALERLRSDERLRREMGKAARARAEQYTWRRHEDALASAYRQKVVEWARV